MKINKPFQWWGTSLATAALLAGCAVGPDYKRPQATTIPDAYTGATNVVSPEAGTTNGWKVAEPQAQISKGNWWGIFGDAELNDLERQASTANQQLKVAVAQLTEARAEMDVARAGLFPNISASGSFVRQRSSANAPSVTTGKSFGTSATFDDFYVPLSLGYELDIWGRVRRSVESARAQTQASLDDLETVKLMIQAEVAVDYFTLRTLDSQRAVLHSSIQVFTKSFKLTRNLRDGGAVSDLDVAQAQTVLKTTEAQLPAVTLQRAQFEHALALLVGQPASTFHIPERALSTAPPLIPPGVPSELLERRPDISAAERRMAAANAGIGVARTAPETTLQEWDRVLAVNLTGPFLLAKYGIPELAAAGGGTMVITGSANSFTADRSWAAYCASKGGLLMLCRALALDHAAEGIRVNIVCPGSVTTPMHDDWLAGHAGGRTLAQAREEDRAAHPLGRVADPAEVARAALFLSCAESSFTTGTPLLVDGGVTA